MLQGWNGTNLAPFILMKMMTTFTWWFFPSFHTAMEEASQAFLAVDEHQPSASLGSPLGLALLIDPGI